MTADNDSADLEALFDSVAADTFAQQTVVSSPAFRPAAPVAPVAPAVPARPVLPPSGMTEATSPAAAAAAASARPPGMVPVNAISGDDDDALQALFDSVSADYSRSSRTAPAAGRVSPAEAEAVMREAHLSAVDSNRQAQQAQQAAFDRVGKMARELHDTLRELGYDKMLESTMAAIPDAKDRLAYIANLTEQAACRVLNATDVAQPLVSSLENSARQLGQRWDQVFANQTGVEDFRLLAEETRQFLKREVPDTTGATNAQLTEIMMAQDFQDLTGQVIKKIVGLAQNLENGLMSVLVELMPSTMRSEEVNSLLNGPVVNADGRADVVVNQQQVDDLLDSLGF